MFKFERVKTAVVQAVGDRFKTIQNIVGLAAIITAIIVYQDAPTCLVVLFSSLYVLQVIRNAYLSEQLAVARSKQ